jgi:hypothetical protein
MAKLRGIFERNHGEFWIQYFSNGCRHRRKAGTKSAAVRLLALRKAAILEGRKLPALRGQHQATFAELAASALIYSRTRKRSYRHYVCRMKKLVEQFGNRAAETITPGRGRGVAQWA